MMVPLHDLLQAINVDFEALLHGKIVLSHPTSLLTDLLLFPIVFFEEVRMFFFAFAVKPSQILNFMAQGLNLHFLSLNLNLLLSIYLISSHD